MCVSESRFIYVKSYITANNMPTNTSRGRYGWARLAALIKGGPALGVTKACVDESCVGKSCVSESCVGLVVVNGSGSRLVDVSAGVVVGPAVDREEIVVGAV